MSGAAAVVGGGASAARTSDFRPRHTAVLFNNQWPRYPTLAVLNGNSPQSQGDTRKAIGVLKKWTSDSERTLLEGEIAEHGVSVGEPLTTVREVLTGTPEVIEPRTEMESARLSSRSRMPGLEVVACIHVVRETPLSGPLRCAEAGADSSRSITPRLPISAAGQSRKSTPVISSRAPPDSLSAARTSHPWALMIVRTTESP